MSTRPSPYAALRVVGDRILLTTSEATSQVPSVVTRGGCPKAETIAVRADGSGTVLWRNQQKCCEQSLWAHARYAYAPTDNAIAFCWRITDGEEMWKQRHRGPVSSSPILVRDKI